MTSHIHDKHSNALLLALLNLLADFDGQIPEEAIAILNELRQRSDSMPPLYADVLGLPSWSTCADLVERVESLSQEQLATASYAFHIFRSYERMLRINAAKKSPEQKAASEAQIERVRDLIARTKTALDEAIRQSDTES